MIRMPFILMVSAVAGLLTASVARLEAEQVRAPGKPLDAADTKFVIAAWQDGEMEARLGDIAMAQASLPDIKAFGSMMATDHNSANGELKALCANRGVQLPAELDPDHQKAADALAKLKGPDFDRAYVDKMVSAHQAAVAEFEAASRNTKDAELKAFIDKTLPVLRHHLKEAQALKVGAK